MTRPVLYDYYRSSACYRVRIALNLKRVAYDAVAVNLLEGAHQSEAYRARNPQGLVPMLEAGELRLAQSIPIIAWLEAAFPEPRLLPADPADAAYVRALALTIACDIHPLNNVRVLRRLKALGVEEAERDQWYRHWIAEGFAALEAMAAPRSGRFLFGDSPTLADVCLVPQMYNARRFETPLDGFPTLVRVDAEASALDAFAAAHPDAIGPPA